MQWKTKYEKTHIPKSGGGRLNATSLDDVIFGLNFDIEISPRESKILKKIFPMRIFSQEPAYIESTYWIIYIVKIKCIIINFTPSDLDEIWGLKRVFKFTLKFDDFFEKWPTCYPAFLMIIHREQVEIYSRSYTEIWRWPPKRDVTIERQTWEESWTLCGCISLYGWPYE